MKTFCVWLTPSPGYEEHGELHPNSTILHHVSTGIGVGLPITLPAKAGAYILVEAALDMLLRHSAEHWSYFKDGCGGERYDADHAEKLFKAYKQRLGEIGFLDFTKPCAGVEV